MECMNAKFSRGVVFSLVLVLTLDYTNSAKYVKECAGGELSLATTGTNQQQYNAYKKMYENCTHVVKNLVIVHLEGNLDMSFLKDIREVAGSVMIISNTVPVIPLTSLVVIRGTTLYTKGNASYSLIVAMNADNASLTNGLHELQLPSLEEILDGDVLFSNNMQMCYDDSINWDYILTRNGAKFTPFTNPEYMRAQRCEGKKCNESCTADDGKSYCWGEGPAMCQKCQ